MYHVPGWDAIEASLDRIESLLARPYGMSGRAVALLLLQGDDEIAGIVGAAEPEALEKIRPIVAEAQARYDDPLPYIIAVRRQEEASRITRAVLSRGAAPRVGFAERLSRIMMNPLTGIPLVLLILYLGLYKFVGGFGAGVLVDLVEDAVFVRRVNPWTAALAERLLPWESARALIAGDYGIVTLGVRYAVAIILPIVATFFIAFAVIEDSGYLPRLAMLIDRLFKAIGLTGRAVIPMVLGLGCDTMATLVTRTLPTVRERLISTILLALAIPCSAQLGVILSLLDGHPLGLWVWVGVMGGVFILVGALSSRVLPGEAPSFYMEIPPLRLPRPANVLIKTYSRVRWYFLEIFPVFILASVVIWAGQMTGLFDRGVALLRHPVRWIGLPDDAAVAFLFGFFRRDYGAAGLFDIKRAGLLTGRQIVVACTTLALFLPCVAQFLITVRERGLRTAVALSAFVFVFSFSVGFLLNKVLVFWAVPL
ncbi:MAG: nucleoside recognition domain-containing protein [bacterium]|nr:nucleoside recognition domain-containing protein [bacterium]